MSMKHQPIGRQIKAARALLGWSAAELAAKAGIRRETVLSIENEQSMSRPATMEKIVSVLENENIEFMENAGVYLRDDSLKIMEGENLYLKLLDDVYYTLKDGGEMLISYACNRLSSDAVIQSELRLRRTGIKFRFLISSDDEYCIFPLNEYRQIPSRFFHNNVQVIYGDKIGSMIDMEKKLFIIHNASFVSTQRKMFNLIWSLHKPPRRTISPETYK